MIRGHFLAAFLAAVGFSLAPLQARALELAFEQDTSLPIVYLNVALKAGYVTDPSGQEGITNFMGEMLLRGTRNRSKAELDLALDQIGARLSVETRAESLIFRGAVLSSQLEPFLALLEEILVSPSLPEKEIEKLRSEIVSGILEELGNDSTLASRRFTRFLFQDHPYGKSTLGTLSDVRKLTRSRILVHYDRLMRDRAMLVVGSGDAQASRIEAWARKLASLRPNGGEAAIPLVSVPETPPGRRLQIVDKPDRTQTQINIGQIGLLMTDPRYFAFHLGNYAFGGGSFTSRLMTEIRVKRGWSYGASSHCRFGLRPRLCQIHLFPASKDTAAALRLTLQMVDELARDGITEEEFEFAKRSLINSSGFMYDTSAKRVENTLLERTLNLPDGFMKSYAGRLEKVSRKDVNQALRELLKPESLTVSVLATAEKLKAPLAEAAGLPLERVQVIPYDREPSRIDRGTSPPAPDRY